MFTPSDIAVTANKDSLAAEWIAASRDKIDPWIEAAFAAA